MTVRKPQFMNAADKLFENILDQLPRDIEEPLSRGHEDSAPGEMDPIDDPPDTPADEIRLYGDDLPADLLRGDDGAEIFEPSANDKDLVEGGIRTRGFDALAFYKSRRIIAARPFPGTWGIFYLKAGLVHVAWGIAETYPGYKDPMRLAHDFLRGHEHFHFRADIQTLMFEAALKKNLYFPLRRALRGRRTHFVEEALANKQAYDWAKKFANGLREYAYDFMSLQPNAYARFEEPRNDLAAEWAANVVGTCPPGNSCLPRYDLAPWVEATPKDFMRTSLCPEYVIFPQRLENWLDPAWIPPPVTQITEGTKLKELLAQKFSQYKQKWEETKRKLLENRMLSGLDFKKWPKEGKDVYSVRVSGSFRAHLRNQGQGIWHAYDIGPHGKMGHG